MSYWTNNLEVPYPWRVLYDGSPVTILVRDGCNEVEHLVITNEYFGGQQMITVVWVCRETERELFSELGEWEEAREAIESFLDQRH